MVLRITIADEPKEQRWTLQGRLSGPWVAQLKSNWKKSHGPNGDRKCVVDGRAVEAVARLVKALEEVGQLRDRLPGLAGPAQPVGVRAREERLVRDVETDHRHGDPTAEDGGRRLWIDEGVELRGRRDVALGDRAAHPDDPLEALRYVRVPLE